MVDFVAPVIVIAVNIPLILGIVPRNWAYGFRTKTTLSSDELWYPANRFAGWACGAAGVVWLAAAWAVPHVAPAGHANGWSLTIGVSALGAALLASLVFLARLPR